MAILKPGYETDYHGSPELYPTACVGRIVEHESLPDGRSDLILRGESAVWIEETESEHPYRVARVRSLPDRGCFAHAPGAVERCEELHRLLERACPGCVRVLREGWKGDFDRDCGVELLHTVAMHLPVGVETKLEWLGCEGSLERWKRIREALVNMGEAREERHRIIRRYGDLLPEDPAEN
jgi:Lon protease-like protein